MAADRGRLWSTKHIANLVRHKAALLEELECDQSMLFPGSRAAIRRLAAARPLGIASGSLRQDIMRVLEREHLVKHFAAVVAAEDTSVSKPAPDPYVRAVDRLSVATGLSLTPSECVAVEDSEWGIDSPEQRACAPLQSRTRIRRPPFRAPTLSSPISIR